MALKTLSRIAGEPASLWIERFGEFQRFWDEGQQDREVFRRSLRLDISDGLDPRRVGNALTTGGMRVHLPHRIHTWFQAEAYDEDPEIRYPRDATGDAGFGPMVEKVVTRVMDEADGVRAFRRGLTDIMSDGCFAVWYGLPNEPTAEDAEFVNITPEDAFEESIGGVHQARPGQDHMFLVQSLMTKAMDTDGMMSWTPEQHMSVFRAAADHARMAREEAKAPRDWTTDRGKVWIKHYQIDDAVAWDTTVSDLDEAFWMAYRVSMHVDRAQTHRSFEPVARKMLRGVPLEHRITPTGGGADGANRPREIRTPEMSTDAVNRENSRVNVWIVFDKRHGTRHMVPEHLEGGQAYYLEVDERDPYVDPETGESVLPTGFPCEVCAPHKSNVRSVLRTFGIAGLAPGWPFILSIQNYEQAIDDMVKRIKRIFVFGRGWSKTKRDQVANGPDGTTVLASAEAIKADPRNAGIYTPTFPDVSAQLLSERDRKLTYLSIVMGIPRSALVGEEVSETLGQAEIAESAGHKQTVDIVKQVSRTWARVAQGVMMLVRTFYTGSDVARIIGEDALPPADPQTGEPTGEPSKWDAWVESSIEGDRLSSRFSATKADENPRRISQGMQVIKLNREVGDPITGLPRKDDSIAFDEIFRALGMGDLPDFEMSPIQQIIMSIQRNPELAKSLIGGGGEGSKPSVESPETPKSGEDSVGPRRSASPVNPQQMG